MTWKDNPSVNSTWNILNQRRIASSATEAVTWLHASVCVIFVDVGTLFVLLYSLGFYKSPCGIHAREK